MEPECSFQCLQEQATCSYPEPCEITFVKALNHWVTLAFLHIVSNLLFTNNSLIERHQRVTLATEESLGKYKVQNLISEN